MIKSYCYFNVLGASFIPVLIYLNDGLLRFRGKTEELKLMENNEEEISLIQMFNVIKNNILVIMGIAVICAVLAFTVTRFFMTPKYTAQTKLCVRAQNVDESTTGSVEAARKTVATCGVVITSDSVADTVIERLDLDYTTKQLQKMIKVAPINNTEVFSISVVCDDPQIAQNIANVLAAYVPDELIRLVRVASVEVVDYAKLPTEKTSPSVSKNTLIGALMGLFLSCAVFIAISLLDNRIRKESDLEEKIGLTVLGSIPTISDTRG